MADVFLATCLLLGGFGLSVLILIAMANHPTGGTDFPKVPFLAGLTAAAAGLLWWIGILFRWVF